ncbi:MAG: WYL domain-containing protein [Nitrospirae bacterium]|nr:WYL domain-containing protein [Nitrospirota bacterium]
MEESQNFFIDIAPIEEQEDGALILRATIQGTRELKWWTYHWIPYCEIISPPELREEVIGEMKAMLDVYGK